MQEYLDDLRLRKLGDIGARRRAWLPRGMTIRATCLENRATGGDAIPTVRSRPLDGWAFLIFRFGSRRRVRGHGQGEDGRRRAMRAQAERLKAIGAHQYHPVDHGRFVIFAAGVELPGGTLPQQLEALCIEGIEQGAGRLRAIERRAARRIGVEHPDDRVLATGAADDRRARVLQGLGLIEARDAQKGRTVRRRDQRDACDTRRGAGGEIVAGLGAAGGEDLGLSRLVAIKSWRRISRATWRRRAGLTNG